MACLFCGKEIGPIRLLRDSEFCSPKHRKSYKDRLQKVLVRVGEPETVPSNVAPFQDTLRPTQGFCRKSEAAFDFSSRKHTARLPVSWSLEIPDAGGSFFLSVDLSARESTSAQPPLAWRAESFPYFDKSSAARLLRLPQPTLGTLVLRSTDGQILSGPIPLDCPAVPRESSRASAPTPLAKSVCDPAFPSFTLSAAECEEIAAGAEPAPSEDWMATPEPEPAVPAGEPSWSLPVSAQADLHVPADLPAAANHTGALLDDFVTPPQPCEAWMRRPAPEPATAALQPSLTIGALPLAAALRFPLALSAPLVSPKPEIHALHLAGPAPSAAQMDARLAAPAIVPFPPALAAPGLVALRAASPAVSLGDQSWMPVPAPEPTLRDVRPTLVQRPLAFAATPVRFAPLVMEPVGDPLQALVEETPPSQAPAREIPVAPRAAAPASPSRLNGHSGKPLLAPPPSQSAPRSPLPISASAAGPQTEVPQPGLLPLDYHCPAGPLAARPNLLWVSRPLSLSMARFAVRPIFDRLEDLSAQKPEPKRPAFTEVFVLPDAAALSRRKAARQAFTAIAASVTVVMALWLGASAGKFGHNLINREAAAEIAAAARVRSGASSSVETASESPARPAPSVIAHPVAWVRTEAAKRATVQLADNFGSGMAAWGVKGKSWAQGWSHSPDGFVRPGQLALFQPSLRYADYRMDFFGQIEDRSMSWVVRGKDTQNYYAMKFNIVEPGMRPVIAMTHYPVVGGKQGHRVVTPLSVMVHNNVPYHVSVEVKGSRFTASIEGQEVDSWSDDTLLAGGVGFFSEAGARARIYWMKVSKNDDWFGWLCGRIAGDGEPADSASLDRPALPAPPSGPPAPAPATAALWPAEAAETWYGKLQRDKGSWKGETETWSS